MVHATNCFLKDSLTPKSVFFKLEPTICDFAKILYQHVYANVTYPSLLETQFYFTPAVPQGSNL
jgi:hypothetical protein